MQQQQPKPQVNFLSTGEPISGSQVIQRMAEESDTILLSFSCGKDSLAAWLACRPHFKRIVPFYMYRIPGLEFVEKRIRYYEEFFQCHIVQVPHPALYRQLNGFAFQAPQRLAIIDAARLPTFTFEELEAWMKQSLKLPPETFTASGIRVFDSLNRRAAVKTRGPINWTKRQFWPVWDMTNQELEDIVKAAGVELAEDYQLFGRSFDGLMRQFMEPLKEHYPQDYATILEWFPFVELEVMRYHLGEDHES